MTIKHSLVIKPAITPLVRHKIEALLKNKGYDVSGGGTHTDMSACDISFSHNGPLLSGDSCQSEPKS